MDPIEPIFITYGAIILMAIIPIWIGAHRSLDQNMSEKLSSQDAWMFPIVGSSFLLGLYLLFKWFSKEYVNLLLSSYFLFFGIFSTTQTLSPWVSRFLSKEFGSKKYKFTIPCPWSKDPFHISFNNSDVIAFFISVGLAVWYFKTKNWVSNNLLGLAFCIQAISMLSLSSYSVGAILLGGLFFYDIFWVFGTDVMVTVAKNFDAPVKLLFPKNVFAETFEFSMLGLGDIVIPGVFIALLLRFDSHLQGRKKKFNETYFSICYISYIIGLVLTIYVMHTFQAAQPALLYLVPACLISSFTTAVVRGELVELFSYSEEIVKEKKKKSSKSQKQSKKDSKSSPKAHPVKGKSTETTKQAKISTKPTTHSNQKSTNKTQTKTQPKSQIKAQPKSTQTKTQSKSTQTKTQSKSTQTKTQPKSTQTKTQPKSTQTKTQPKSTQTKTQTKSKKRN